MKEDEVQVVAGPDHQHFREVLQAFVQDFSLRQAAGENKIREIERKLNDTTGELHLQRSLLEDYETKINDDNTLILRLQHELEALQGRVKTLDKKNSQTVSLSSRLEVRLENLKDCLAQTCSDTQQSVSKLLGNFAKIHLSEDYVRRGDLKPSKGAQEDGRDVCVSEKNVPVLAQNGYSSEGGSLDDTEADVMVGNKSSSELNETRELVVKSIDSRQFSADSPSHAFQQCSAAHERNISTNDDSTKNEGASIDFTSANDISPSTGDIHSSSDAKSSIIDTSSCQHEAVTENSNNIAINSGNTSSIDSHAKGNSSQDGSDLTDNTPSNITPDTCQSLAKPCSSDKIPSGDTALTPTTPTCETPKPENSSPSGTIVQSGDSANIPAASVSETTKTENSSATGTDAPKGNREQGSSRGTRGKRAYRGSRGQGPNRSNRNYRTTSFSEDQGGSHRKPRTYSYGEEHSNRTRRTTSTSEEQGGYNTTRRRTTSFNEEHVNTTRKGHTTTYSGEQGRRNRKPRASVNGDQRKSETTKEQSNSQSIDEPVATENTEQIKNKGNEEQIKNKGNEKQTYAQVTTKYIKRHTNKQDKGEQNTQKEQEEASPQGKANEPPTKTRDDRACHNKEKQRDSQDIREHVAKSDIGDHLTPSQVGEEHVTPPTPEDQLTPHNSVNKTPTRWNGELQSGQNSESEALKQQSEEEQSTCQNNEEQLSSQREQVDSSVSISQASYGNSDEQTPTQESQEQTLTQESQEQTLTQESQEQTLTQESQEQTLTQESQAQTITQENQEQTLTQESQEQTLTQESQEQTLTQESQEQTLTQESQEQTLTQESQEQTITQENQEQTPIRERQAQTQTQESQEQTLTQESQEQTPTRESQAQTQTQESQEQTLTQESQEQTLTQESQEQTSTQESQEQTLTQESQEQTPTQKSQEQTQTQKSQEQTPTKKSQEQTPTQKSQEQTPTQKSQEQTPTQKSQEQTKSEDNEEHLSAQVSNKKTTIGNDVQTDRIISEKASSQDDGEQTTSKNVGEQEQQQSVRTRDRRVTFQRSEAKAKDVNKSQRLPDNAVNTPQRTARGDSQDAGDIATTPNKTKNTGARQKKAKNKQKQAKKEETDVTEDRSKVSSEKEESPAAADLPGLRRRSFRMEGGEEQQEPEVGMCANCGFLAKLRCANCRQAFYCKRECQREHWKNGHKDQCQPFQVLESAELGRYMVASRDLKAGDVILKEDPIVVGPKQITEPICLGCYARVDGSYRCQKCNWPMCGPACESSPDHLPECVVGQEIGSPIDIANFDEPNHFYEVIFPLRCLALKKKSPKKYEQLLSLESHYEDRKGTHVHQENQKSIVNFLRNYFFIQEFPIEDIDSSEKSIHTITGITDVNSLELRLKHSEVLGLYPTFAMLEHSCTPNSKHTFNKERQVIVKAAVDIKRGEHISTMYTHVLWGTAARRDHLKHSKYFMCTCFRCSDPTELGTHFSALRCKQCPNGFMLSAAPLDELAAWICTSCNATVTSDEVKEINLKIGEEVEAALAMPSVDSLEKLVQRHGKNLVHPNHFHLFAARHTLLQMYGRDPSSAGEESMKKKEKMCQDFLKVCTALDPGMSRLAPYAGIALYEYHLAVLARARQEPDAKHVDSAALKKDVETAKALLQQCIRVLQDEPEDQPEGQLCQVAQQNLAELRQWEATLSSP